MICEDEKRYREELVRAIARWKEQSGHDDVETTAFSSSEDLLEQLSRRAEIDLLFVDIQIPGEMDGISLARKIRQAHLDTTIVFCTNYSEYVFEGYTVNALRYLKKPVSQEDVSFCCDYVYSRMALERGSALSVFSAGKRYVFRHRELRAIEVRLHTLYLFTTLDSQPLRISASLSDIEADLPGGLFVRCHRSFIVNIAHVRMLTRTQCVLSDGSSLPVSRTFASIVNQAFDRYHQGEVQ